MTSLNLELKMKRLVKQSLKSKIQAADGTIIEIAEWKSNEAIEKAHQSPKVIAIWNKISSVSELTSLSSLAESKELFPNFKPF